MGTLFYGKEIAQKMHEFVKSEIDKTKKDSGIEPVMVTIKLDQENSLRMAEARLHTTIANQLGIQVREIFLDSKTSGEELIRLIKTCNEDLTIHGILVLLPLPDHIDQEAVLSAIADEKELEGLREVEGKQSNVLAALLSVFQAIAFDPFKNNCVFFSDESTLKFNAVIRKVLQKAASLNLPVIPLAKEVANVQEITKKADLLAVSLQTPGFVDQQYIKEGAIVIDFNPIFMGEKYCEKKGALVPVIQSSLNVDSLLEKAKYVFPVTGGIGPIALANLMRNFLHNYKRAVVCEAASC